ncbi:MAG: tape measure domain-containing protein, partial [Acinetobacter sp.]
ALSFTDGLYLAGEQVSGFQKFIDLLNIALSFLSDGFKTIGIGVNIFTGTLYGLAAVWYELKATLSWGDVKDEAIANMEAMRAKSEEYFTKGFDGAKNLESKTIETIQNIGKTDKEKNQERIADSQQTLDQLKAQEEKHKTDYKAISDERIQLEQQLFEARKAGNDAAIQLAVDNLAKLDTKEKEYQAESQKITDAKIQAAQDWVNAQLTAADGTQKAADVATQKTLQTTLAAQNLKIEFDSAGKAIVKAMDDGAKATENQGNATDKARKAATALGLDLDVSLNRVSAKFKESGVNVDNFAVGLEGLGVAGKQAANVTYEAWLKWLETAKSQAEIDFAKTKLKEFGAQGQISTSQVEQGLIAIKLQAQKLPDDIDPVTEAFKRLGIETKENLKLAAQQALMDYITIRDSGKATAEGVQKAYEKAAQAAAVSGDAGVISATNAAN